LQGVNLQRAGLLCCEPPKGLHFFLGFPVINLWACRIIYAICCIAATIIFPIWAIISIVRDITEVPAALLIVIPLTVICAVPFIFAARLACEWYIIVFDWIVETTKAARKYNDE